VGGAFKVIKVKVGERKGDRVEFNVSGIKENVANALRRTIISDVPIMAVENVTFYQNSSVMDDEVLAHRLGLIPLRTDPEGTETVTLTLEAAGPGTVYSKSMTVKEAKTKSKKKTESISVYDTIPIIKLTEGQKIEIEATAQIGRGRDHIKWQGGLASYEKKEDGSFDFFVESYGQLPVEDLIDAAFGEVGRKIKELKSVLK
jgi:DNA-directed RNA polymerase subunit D